jgi:uncharacterized protein (TIGR00251 family)
MVIRPRHMDLIVKVVPKSSRSEVGEYLANGALKVKVAAAPEKGKANAELRAVLAKHFGVPERNVVIVSGQTSQLKRIRIT